MEAQELRLVVLMPLRDDWVSAAELIRRLDQAIPGAGIGLSILMVDDGSLQHCAPSDFQSEFIVIRSVNVLRLRRNLGHQRAIAIGLAHLHANVPCDAVLVMDADGEDTPEGVVELIQAFTAGGGKTAIFAARSRRSESPVFKFFYRIYRVVHFWLTGISVRVGNFSIVSASGLTTLVAMSELWNHYAAAVFRSRLSFRMIPIPRGYRIAGVSRMNFAALVSHGLSAISVFADVVGVRLLIASLVASLLSAIGIGIVVVERFFTRQAIPGWATSAVGVLVIIMIQCITIATSFTFFMLSNRMNLGFVPFRDYPLFVEDVVEIYPCERSI